MSERNDDGSLPREPSSESPPEQRPPRPFGLRIAFYILVVYACIYVGGSFLLYILEGAERVEELWQVEGEGTIVLPRAAPSASSIFWKSPRHGTENTLFRVAPEIDTACSSGTVLVDVTTAPTMAPPAAPIVDLAGEERRLGSEELDGRAR